MAQFRVVLAVNRPLYGERIVDARDAEDAMRVAIAEYHAGADFGFDPSIESSEEDIEWGFPLVVESSLAEAANAVA